MVQPKLEEIGKLGDINKDTLLVEMPIDVLKQLKWLAEETNKTPIEALRQALSTEVFIRDEIEKNGSVYLVKKKSSKEIAKKSQ